MTKRIDGCTLKIVAALTMFIDHFGASVVEGAWMAGRRIVSYRVYLALRLIGRIAFPIYAFLIVEGFRHTGNVWKYMGRLFFFALMSEILFDLAFYRTPVNWHHQNVYFTLALGLLALWLWDFFRTAERIPSRPLRYLLAASSVLAVAAAAHFLKTDYSQWGILTIAAFYVFTKSEWLRDIASGCALLASSPLEAASFIDYVLFHFYNGKRGRQSKYFFYFFYPGHLALLAMVNRVFFGV